MVDISLLPEELRGKEEAEKKKKTARAEKIKFTEPTKEKIKREETQVKIEKKSWLKNLKEFFNQRKKAKELAKKEKEIAKKEKGILKKKKKEPPVKAAQEPISIFQPSSLPQSPPPAKPVAREEKEAKIKIKSPQRDSWWAKVFSKKDSREKKQPEIPKIPIPVKKSSPPEEVKAKKGEKLHIPRETGRPTFGLEVNLAKKTLLFYHPELYSKIKRALLIFILILLLLGIAYFLLIYYQSSLAQPAEDVSTQISQLEKKLQSYQQKKEEVVTLDRKLVAVKRLISRHYYWTHLFEFLEEQTIPEVYYDSLSIDSNGRIALSVVAKDYPAVAKQIAVFQKATDKIAKVIFNTATLRTKLVSQAEGEEIIIEALFNLEFHLQPDFFFKK